MRKCSIDFISNRRVRTFWLEIKNSNIGRRMVSGVFWSFTGTALAKFLVLLAGMIVARILGKEEYGELGMIRSTVYMFVALGTVGLGLTATKYISEYRSRLSGEIASIILITTLFGVVAGLGVTSLIVVLAPYLANTTLNAPYLVTEVRWGGILLFLTVVNSLQNGILAGFENFKAIAVNTFFAGVGEFICIILGAYYYGVIGAICGSGCGFLILSCLHLYTIKKELRINGITIKGSCIKRNDLQILYKFSLPATFSSLMVAPVFWYVRSMLVRYGGFGAMGIYEVADQWKIIILFIPSAISQIVLPILSNMVGCNDNRSYWKLLKYNIYLNVSVTFVLSLLVILCSHWILGFYGNSFTDVEPIVILAFSTVFTSFANVVGLAISSRAKMWVGFVFNALWACILIGVSYYFLNLGWGASGLAWAVLVSYIIHSFVQFFYLYLLQRRCDLSVY